MRSITLAHTPPQSSIVTGLFHLLVLICPVWLAWLMFTGKQSPWNTSDRGIAGILLFVFGVWAAFHLLSLVPIIQRWVFAFGQRAGVFLKQDTVEFRVPLRRSRWNPLLRMEAMETLLNGLRKTAFDNRRKSSLLIDTERGTICVPSGTFGVGGYTLEEQLRQHSPGLQPPLSGIVTWQASTKTRLALLGTGAAILTATSILIAFVYSPVYGPTGDPWKMLGFPTLSLLAFLFGLGSIFLSMIHRGRVVVDSRGVFHERSGTLNFVSWESFQNMKRSNDMGIITLTVKGNWKQAVYLTQVLGMGFPLSEIQETIETKRMTRTQPRGGG